MQLLLCLIACLHVNCTYCMEKLLILVLSCVQSSDLTAMMMPTLVGAAIHEARGQGPSRLCRNSKVHGFV